MIFRRARRHPYRILVVGGCQGVGIGAWASLLIEGAHAEGYHVGISPDAMPDVLAARLREFDLVICQLADESGHGPLEITRLRHLHRNVVYLPLFAFTGFHPDMFAYPFLDGSGLKGPLDAVQSRLIVGAHRLGISRKRVPDLFNALVFSRLGYFEQFSMAKDATVGVLSRAGYDYSEQIERRMRQSCFMYINNHPNIDVLGDLTYLALKKARLKPRKPETLSPPRDILSLSVQVPLYPPLAKFLGLAGSLHFARTELNLARQSHRWLLLNDMVDKTYDLLDNHSPDAFLVNPALIDTMTVLKQLAR